MKRFFWLLVSLGLAACGNAQRAAPTADQLLACDFETLEYWLPDELAATLSHDQAHSGHTALKVDDTHEYSLGYKKPLGYFLPQRPARLRVSAWVLLPDAQAAATLVTSLSDPANPAAKDLLWAGLKLDEAVRRRGQWTQVSQVVTLPPGLQDTHLLNIYLWRHQPGPAVYLDDLQVRREP